MDDEPLQGEQPATRSLADPERDGLEYPLHQDSARPPSMIVMNPDDGTPRQIPNVSFKDSLAPRLTPERFVCMADTSAFVERDDYGYVVRSYTPDQVERTPAGDYRLKLLDGWVPYAGSEMKDEKTKNIFSRYVQPLRPQCAHYVRQLIPWPDDTSVTRCQRFCAAMKNDQGELISLSDQEILACEMRLPRDFVADQKLDEFDDLIIDRGAQAAKEKSEFDIDAELAQENLGVLGGNT